jgi:RNA polymerase sigma factor (sigma-70 family)
MTLSLNTRQHEARDNDHEQYMRGLVMSMTQRGVDAEKSLSLLYDLTVRRVVVMIGRFLVDRELVAELTQDVFFQAWNQADQFDAERGSVLAWLLIIARSKALDARRRRNVQPVLFDSDVADAMLEMMPTQLRTGADAMQTRQEQRLLQEATLKLSPIARHIVALSFFSGLSHTEISAHLDLPLGTIKTNLRRGLATMAKELERASPGIRLHLGLNQLRNQRSDVEFSADI